MGTLQDQSGRPCILIVEREFYTNERQMLRGFLSVAAEQDWMVLRTFEHSMIAIRMEEWDVDAVVVGSTSAVSLPDSVLQGLPVIGMNVSPDVRKIPCARPDDTAIGVLAAQHLLSKGFTNFSTFSFDDSRWVSDRIGGFARTIRAGDGKLVSAGRCATDQSDLFPSIRDWLRSLPKGTAIFACCDSWGSMLLLICRTAGITVPEELVVLGVDDDDLVCETSQPYLSSIRVPWQEVGRATARLVRQALDNQRTGQQDICVAPLGVVERRSTDFTTAGHPAVAHALRYLHDHADQPLSVDAVVDHVITSRRWLEQAFRKYLGRTILQEIRRVHLDRARYLLATTGMAMPVIAQNCGFGSSVSRFSRTFHQQEGMTPSDYRRRFSLRK